MMLLFCLIFSDAATAEDGIETAGSVIQFVLPASAAGLILANHDQKGFVQLAESGILTFGITYGLKYTISETRPNGGRHSFPSGHSSTSFASAEFIRERYGWSCGIPAYLAASFVGYSRVESKEHFTRDVIAGALIGIGSSCLFTSPGNTWNARPLVGSSFYGVGLTRNW
ncbi:MAG: phosphatase PAP2 family protein [Chlorobiaceae bacterium]|nr:phosphatase PAP2 family protein [Chlorobiaceae bacterium]